MSLNTIKLKIIPILKEEGVLKAAFFGSFARGDFKKKSDIDLLVELDDKKTLLDLVGLKLNLEDVLNKKVDVLTYDGLNPLLREQILNEQQIIYEKKS